MENLDCFENKYSGIEFKYDGLYIHPFGVNDFFNSLQIENDLEIQSLYYFTIEGTLNDILCTLKKGIEGTYEKWVKTDKIEGVISEFHSDLFYSDWTPIKEKWSDIRRFENLKEEMINKGIEKGMEFLYNLHQNRHHIILCCYDDLFWVDSGLHRVSIAKQAKYPEVYAEIIYCIPSEEFKVKCGDAVDYVLKLIKQSSKTIDLKLIKELFEENLLCYKKSVHPHHNTGTRTIEKKNCN